MRQQAGATGNATGLIGTNAANQRGADYMTNQLTPLFDNPAQANAFVNKMQLEQQIQSSSNNLVGNSATAARLAQDAAPGNEGSPGLAALGHLSIGGGAMLHGDPLLMATQVPSFFRNLGRMGASQANRPEVQAAMARRLFTSDPAANAQTLSQLMASPPSRFGSAITIPTASAVGAHPIGPTTALAQMIANRIYGGEEQPATTTGAQ